MADCLILALPLALLGVLTSLFREVVGKELCKFSNTHGYEEFKSCNRGCCGSTEEDVCCGLDNNVIAGYVLGAVGAGAVVAVIVCVCVKKKLAHRGRVISTQHVNVKSQNMATARYAARPPPNPFLTNAHPGYQHAPPPYNYINPSYVHPPPYSPYHGHDLGEGFASPAAPAYKSSSMAAP